MRKTIQGKNQKSELGFRYRGLRPTRLENLTDTIFGFIVTLLVISSEVPKNYLELQSSMYSFIGFVFCILLLLGIWNNHRVFFLHYGLQDGKIRVLNILFLFILLFYVYPLKYLFSYLGTSMYVQIKLSLGDRSESLLHVVDNLKQSHLEIAQWEDIMIRFGLGLFCIYLILLLMHLQAYKKRKILKLNKKEKYLTKTTIGSYIILVLITVISMMIVWIFSGEYASLSGLVYVMIPFVLFLNKKIRQKRYNKKKKKSEEVLNDNNIEINLPPVEDSTTSDLNKTD
ncbi:MAG: TMEM175 family protein [Cellulophaga sp.]|nr:TMEM175 family protein [Cellulophaga sp.]